MPHLWGGTAYAGALFMPATYHESDRARRDGTCRMACPCGRSPQPEAALHLSRFVVAAMNPAGFTGARSRIRTCHRQGREPIRAHDAAYTHTQTRWDASNLVHYMGWPVTSKVGATAVDLACPLGDDIPRETDGMSSSRNISVTGRVAIRHSVGTGEACDVRVHHPALPMLRDTQDQQPAPT